MNPRDNDFDWTDERINALYRAMAGQASVPDLLAPVMAAVAQGSGRDGANRRRLTPRPAALGGIAATVAIAAVIGAAVMIRTANSTAPNPIAAASLKTLTVSQANAEIASGTPTNTELLAVEGWLQPSVNTQNPPVACPTTQEGVFGIGCGGDYLVATETSKIPSAELHAVVLPGTSLPDSLPRAGQPVPIVLVGHTRDLRASLCSAAAKAACEKAFVLDQVASLDGSSLGPSVSVVGGENTPKPGMSASQLSRALESVVQPGSQVVSMTAVSLDDAWQSFSPGLAPSGIGEQVLWYVRVAGPPPLSPSMPQSHAGSGILVLDDATGSILGGAGWGWDPTKAGVALPDGEVSLHTTNWLPGNGCRGVGRSLVLRGSPDDPRVAWLEEAATPGSGLGTSPPLTAIWPAGYRARFTPKIEIVDGSGVVVLRDGDLVTGDCGEDPATNGVYLQPPFR